MKLIVFRDYSVSLAEILIPASDISQHISTAGTEGASVRRRYSRVLTPSL